MKEIIPVKIPKNAFAFCKYTFALSLWASVLMKSQLLVSVVFVALILSVLLKVKKAPFVYIYTETIEKLRPGKSVLVDQNAVLFAHLVGGLIAGIGLILLLIGFEWIGWMTIGVLAILKTSGAFGKCGAMKLYSCLNNPEGQCCRFGKKVKERCE
jgi:hypothetical protein